MLKVALKQRHADSRQECKKKKKKTKGGRTRRLLVVHTGITQFRVKGSSDLFTEFAQGVNKDHNLIDDIV